MVMKKGKILNRDLSEAIASMGHGDIMLVTDAGFPIPEDAWRIDLALTRNQPKLEKVLEVISGSLIPETISYAEDVPKFNPELEESVKEIFEKWAPDYEPVPHEELLEEYGQRAKVIVRTGAFNPWGNIALISGVDPRLWFEKESVKAPEDYKKKIGLLNERNSS